MNKKIFNLIRFFSIVLVLAVCANCKHCFSEPTKRLERKFVERKDHLESLYYLLREIKKDTDIYGFVYKYQKGPVFVFEPGYLIAYEQALEDKRFRDHKEKLQLVKVLFQQREFQNAYIHETMFRVVVEGGGVLGADTAYIKMLNGAKIEDFRLSRYRLMPGETDWYSYYD